MSATPIDADGSRLAALQKLARDEGLDAIVAMSPENFAWATNLHIITVNLLRPRQAFAIIPAQGEPELVVCSIEKSLAESDSPIRNVHIYTEFVDNPIDVLVGRLSELGLSSGRIGMDMDYLPASSHERLRKRLHNIVMENTTEAVAAIRAIKSPAEIALLERAAKSTHRAVLDAMASSKLGDSEREMCHKIASDIIRNGADGTLFLCFASGERTPMAHAMPSDRVPVESEVIRFDLGGVYGSYASDFARTYSSGNPTASQRDTYRALVRVQRDTIAAVRPGMLAEDLFFVCRDAFKTHGLPFHMPHIGHSFGVELHESPMLRPGEKTQLKPGMVFNIEPATADSDGNMYHTEDLIEVTASGYRLMTLGIAPDEMPVIGQQIAI